MDQGGSLLSVTSVVCHFVDAVTILIPGKRTISVNLPICGGISHVCIVWLPYSFLLNSSDEQCTTFRVIVDPTRSRSGRGHRELFEMGKLKRIISHFRIGLQLQTSQVTVGVKIIYVG